MERTLQAARRAKRRLTARDVVQRAGRWLVAGAAAGAVLVGAEKILGLPGAWWIWVAGPLAVAGLGAVALELGRRRALLESAAQLDDRLGLKDRLSSALALAKQDHDPFAALAVEESERVAPTADAARALPIRFGTSWWTWPTIVAASVAGALWLPESALLRAREDRRLAKETAAQEQVKAADEVAAALKGVERAATAPAEQKDASADPLAARRLASLEKLEEELRTGKIDADRAREEGAKKLDEAARELAERSNEAQQTADATRERLAKLAVPAKSEESALTRAVRHGDLRAAREAARELFNSADKMSPEERERVARDLEQLSGELDAKEASGESGAAKERADGAASGSETNAQPAPKTGGAATDGAAMDPGLKKDLNDQGLSDKQVEELRDAQKSAEEAQRALEKLGVPPEAARRLAERVEGDAQRRRAEQTAKEKTDELSRAMKQVADSLREEQPANTDQNKPEEGAKDAQAKEKEAAGSPASSEKKETKSGEQKGDGKATEQSTAEKNTGQEGTKQGERTGAKPTSDGTRSTAEQNRTGAEKRAEGTEKKDGTAQPSAKNEPGAKPSGDTTPKDGQSTQGATEKKDGTGQPSGKNEPGAKPSGDTTPKDSQGTQGATEKKDATAQPSGKNEPGAKPTGDATPKDSQGTQGATEKKDGTGQPSGKNEPGAKPSGDAAPKDSQGTQGATEKKDGAAQPSGKNESGAKPSGDAAPKDNQGTQGATEKKDGTAQPSGKNEPGAKPSGDATTKDSQGTQGAAEKKDGTGQPSGKNEPGAKPSGEATPKDGQGTQGATEKKDGTAQPSGKTEPGAKPSGEKKDGAAEPGKNEATEKSSQPSAEKGTPNEKDGAPTEQRDGAKPSGDKQTDDASKQPAADPKGQKGTGATGAKQEKPATSPRGGERGDQPQPGKEAEQKGTPQQKGDKQTGKTGEEKTPEATGEKSQEQAGSNPEKQPGDQQPPQPGEKPRSGEGNNAPPPVKPPPGSMVDPPTKDTPSPGGEQDDGKLPNLDNLPSPDSPQGKAIKQLIKNIQNMDSDQQNARRDRQTSEEMKDRARRLLENATPEQRKKLEQWAKELARENGAQQNDPQRGDRSREGNDPRGPNTPEDLRGMGDGNTGPERNADPADADGNRPHGAGVGDQPGTAATRNPKSASPPAPGQFRTDVVDARPRGEPAKGGDGRVVGELAGDGKPGAPVTSHAETLETIQKAKESAQRAIDDRTIPGRYDKLLRKYFKRLPEKVSEGEKK